jgi:hypothetical protein
VLYLVTGFQPVSLRSYAARCAWKPADAVETSLPVTEISHRRAALRGNNAIKSAFGAAALPHSTMGVHLVPESFRIMPLVSSNARLVDGPFQ